MHFSLGSIKTLLTFNSIYSNIFRFKINVTKFQFTFYKFLQMDVDLNFV